MNTVVLFLEKYDEHPKYFKIVEDIVQAIFNSQKISEWMDNEILEDYIEHIGTTKNIYEDFIEENIDFEKFSELDYFKIYYDSFISTFEYRKKIDKIKSGKLTKQEQTEKIKKLFYSYINIKIVEKYKILYFALVRNQKTLVIKSPKNKEEQYEFLGYQ